MASYQSRKNNNTDAENSVQNNTQSFDSRKDDKKQQEKDASKKVAKTGAKAAATYFGGPIGGKLVDMASKTKAGDKILNKGGENLSKMPGMAKAAKKLDDAGLVDAADKAIDVAGGEASNKTSQQAATNSAEGGAKKAGGSSSNTGGDSSFLNNGSKKSDKKEDNSGDGGQDSSFSGKAKISQLIKSSLMAIAPVFLLFILIIVVIASIAGAINNFTDALGVSKFFGLPSGDQEVKDISKKSQDFYARIEKVKKEFAEQGKNIDPLLITAVYYVGNRHNSFKIDYKYMTEDRIRDIANAMFSGDSTVYSEDTFRDNLKNKIFKSYFPFSWDKTRQNYTDEVFEYIDEYYEIIGYNNTTSCSPLGTCVYDISNGFYIYGKGNVSKKFTLTNLKVRLMESGNGYGGTFGKPMDGEELIDFEKYVLGVAYAEIGPNAPDEAIKAQMVAARSYILARPTDMGGWRTITQEGDYWVLQAAGSTQDQVYCDPDRGCSATNGQSAMVHSGLAYTGYQKPPLPADSKLRTLASETAGEVLVNSSGYVIYAGFIDKDQNKMSDLAKLNYNYKQILLEIYNSANRPYGASDIKKMSCNNGGDACVGIGAASGDFTTWKQIEGPWISVPVGSSGKTIKQIGCLATSVAIQIARSGVPTVIQGDFNPGTFVQYLNSHGGFAGGGNFLWNSATMVAPSFKFQSKTPVSGYSKDQKYNTLSSLINQGCYVVAEVKGNTGQHWVAIDTVANGEVTMMDPGSSATNLWAKYNWVNTSNFACFKVG